MIDGLAKQKYDFNVAQESQRENFQSKIEGKLKTYAVKQLRTEAWAEKINGLTTTQKISAYVAGFFQEVLRFITCGAYAGRVEKPTFNQIEEKVTLFETEISNKVEQLECQAAEAGAAADDPADDPADDSAAAPAAAAANDPANNPADEPAAAAAAADDAADDAADEPAAAPQDQ